MRRYPITGLLALMAFEVGAVGALHRAGSLPWLQPDWEQPWRWLSTTPPGDVFASVLRLVALGCAYWLVTSTVLYVLARLTRLPGLVRTVGWATLPGVCRIADRALAITLAASVLGGPVTGLASEPSTPPADRLPVIYEHRDGILVPPGAGPHPAATHPMADTAGSGARFRPPDPPSVLPRAEQLTYQVSPGDNLWAISERLLAEVRGREVGVGEVAAYWAEVLRANAGRIRSGDPDLIFPGETILLPEPPEEERQ